jgi:hypothetical protein
VFVFSGAGTAERISAETACRLLLNRTPYKNRANSAVGAGYESFLVDGPGAVTKPSPRLGVDRLLTVRR